MWPRSTCARSCVCEKRGGSVTSETSSVCVSCTVDCACLTALSQTAGARRLLTRVVGQCGWGAGSIMRVCARYGSALRESAPPVLYPHNVRREGTSRSRLHACGEVQPRRWVTRPTEARGGTRTARVPRRPLSRSGLRRRGSTEVAPGPCAAAACRPAQSCAVPPPRTGQARKHRRRDGRRQRRCAASRANKRRQGGGKTGSQPREWGVGVERFAHLWSA